MAVVRSGKAQKTAISPTRQQDYAEWYQQVIRAADLAENAPDRWVVSFMEHNVGYYDSYRKVFEPTNAVIPPQKTTGAGQPL